MTSNRDPSPDADAVVEFPPDLQEEMEFWERLGEESWRWILQWEKEVAEGKVQRQ